MARSQRARSPPKHDRCPCEKVTLIIFNFLLWLIAIAFVVAAAWAWYVKGYYDELVKGVMGWPVDPVFVIMGAGLLVLLISCTGCLGSLRENICCLKIFSGTISTVILLQVVVTVLSFVYPDFFQNKLDDFIALTIERYRDDLDLQNMIDFTQKNFECCGARGPQDWNENKYFKCDNKISVNNITYRPVEECGVPYSCCKVVNDPSVRDKNRTEYIINTQCGYGARKLTTSEKDEKIYIQGCLVKFDNWLKTDIYKTIVVILIIFVVQIIPVCLASNSVNLIYHTEKVNTDWTRYQARHEQRQRTAYDRIMDQMDYFTLPRNAPPPYNPDYTETNDLLPQPAPRTRHPDGSRRGPSAAGVPRTFRSVEGDAMRQSDRSARPTPQSGRQGRTPNSGNHGGGRGERRREDRSAPSDRRR